MAYLEQIQCSKMAAAYWTNEEVKNDPNYSPLMDNYTSHFNNKLNTCLISEAFNSLSNYTPEKPGKPYSSITTAEEVIDVVSGKTLVQSMYTTSNYARPWPKNAPNGVSTTTMSSTSDYEFQKEAQALMSQ